LRQEDLDGALLFRRAGHPRDTLQVAAVVSVGLKKGRCDRDASVATCPLRSHTATETVHHHRALWEMSQPLPWLWYVEANPVEERAQSGHDRWKHGKRRPPAHYIRSTVAAIGPTSTARWWGVYRCRWLTLSASESRLRRLITIPARVPCLECGVANAGRVGERSSLSCCLPFSLRRLRLLLHIVADWAAVGAIPAVNPHGHVQADDVVAACIAIATEARRPDAGCHDILLTRDSEFSPLPTLPQLRATLPRWLGHLKTN
jgi:hypothetical protein